VLVSEALAFNTSLFTLHEKCDNLGRNEGYVRHRGRNLTLDISNFIDDRLFDNAGMKKG